MMDIISEWIARLFFLGLAAILVFVILGYGVCMVIEVAKEIRKTYRGDR